MIWMLSWSDSSVLPVARAGQNEFGAISLCPLLTGKGLQVYSSMPPEEADDYAGLKEKHCYRGIN